MAVKGRTMSLAAISSALVIHRCDTRMISSQDQGSESVISVS